VEPLYSRASYIQRISLTLNDFVLHVFIVRRSLIFLARLTFDSSKRAELLADVALGLRHYKTIHLKVISQLHAEASVECSTKISAYYSAKVYFNIPSRCRFVTYCIGFLKHRCIFAQTKMTKFVFITCTLGRLYTMGGTIFHVF